MHRSSKMHEGLKNSISVLVWFTVSHFCIWHVAGHGRMVDPPARNTMWREGFTNPVNYDDDEQFCGGITKQWVDNNGQCGVCGDSFDEVTPRKHEMGGYFGNGIIVRTYRPGEVINVTVILSTNHQGWMEWRLCAYRDPKKEVTQKCLDEGLLPMAETYKTRYIIPQDAMTHNFTVTVQLKLPERFVCKNCVLQWHYYTGNFWGPCPDGEPRLGCGPQETYKNCADVSVGYYNPVHMYNRYIVAPSISNYYIKQQKPVP